MKALNTMKFVVNATREFETGMAGIRAEEDFEIAKKLGCRMLGYIDGLIVFLNTMICEENNEFTGDFGAQLDEWCSEVYDVIASKAIDAKADPEYICRMFRNRDEYRESAKAQWEE